MSEFHDVYPQYEMMAHHDEEQGKKTRKKLWGVFWLLLIVTIVEVVVGFYAADWGLSKTFLKVFFIAFTIVKAFYIVYTFMHLGDEHKLTKWVIIAPFTAFVLYLIFMVTVGEGNYAKTKRLDAPAATEQHHDAGGHH
ncbi:MAG: hypothetical protein Fur0041_16930 [Bacteroidia bacterium]